MLKAIIKKTPIVGPGALYLHRSFKNWRLRRFFRGKSRTEIFTQIYEQNFWSDRMSRSGAGSNYTNTENIRRVLPVLLAELSIGSVLDIPCGDFNWMKEVDLGEVRYVGGDIVEKLIANNNRHHCTTNRSFLTLDLLRSPLPMADLILCRDCLVHLPFEDIWLALKNMQASGAKYALITHFPDLVENRPLPDSHWRPLNFELAPFHFRSPLRAIAENESGKTISLWRIAELPFLRKRSTNPTYSTLQRF